MPFALVTTGSNREHIIADKLRRKGLSVRFFRVHRTLVRRGKLHSKLAPAYARYLFASIYSDSSPYPQWRTMIETEAFPVRGAEQSPVIISDELVEGLSKRGIDDIFSEEITSRFKAGDKVEIVGGIFMGKVGEFERPTGLGQAIVLLEAFGAKTRFPIKESDLTLYQPKRRNKRRRPNGRRVKEYRERTLQQTC